WAARRNSSGASIPKAWSLSAHRRYPHSSRSRSKFSSSPPAGSNGDSYRRYPHSAVVRLLLIGYKQMPVIPSGVCRTLGNRSRGSAVLIPWAPDSPHLAVTQRRRFREPPFSRADKTQIATKARGDVHQPKTAALTTQKKDFNRA